MTSWPTNYFNWVTTFRNADAPSADRQLAVELSWVELCRYKRGLTNNDVSGYDNFKYVKQYRYNYHNRVKYILYLPPHIHTVRFVREGKMIWRANGNIWTWLSINKEHAGAAIIRTVLNTVTASHTLTDVTGHITNEAWSIGQHSVQCNKHSFFAYTVIEHIPIQGYNAGEGLKG